MNGYKPIVNVQNLNPTVESSSSVGPHQKTVNSDGGVVYKDVVIIGAGCAGVECASKLYSCGFENILVLEAQDYIGGRIKTVYVDEIDNQFPLEMGANWIHGYLGNPLYKLVLENPELFQHKKKFLFETITAVCADARTGRVVDTALCERLWLDYLDWNAEAKNYWESRQKSDYKNYAQFIMDRLETQMNELGDDAETRKLKIAIMTRLLKQETIESGCSSMSLCSLNEYGSYSKPIGPDYEFPGGYSKMIQFLAKRLPESSIKVCHAVKHLRLLDHDAVDDCRNVSPSKSSPSKCRNQSHSIEIECTNGFRVRAKHVVVTCSLNYLKHSYKSMFDPRLLTPSKVEAIETVKMGVVDKIFLLYDDLASFWPEGVNAVHPIFLDGESGQLATDHNGLAKAICQDDETDVHKPTTPWYRKVFTFDRFYDNLLLVWITGWQAEVAEKLPNEEISRTLTDLLRRTLSNPRVPEPKKVIKTTWSSNPYVMGSYSYVDVNGSALTHINNLAEPVFINKIPRVLFAGEATHLRYYSTVHGAYLSGQREARRLLEFYSTVSRL